MTFFSVLNLLVVVSSILVISITEITFQPYDFRTIIWKIVLGVDVMWFVGIGFIKSVSDLFLTITKVF
jgi:hypothetical protein